MVAMCNRCSLEQPEPNRLRLALRLALLAGGQALHVHQVPFVGGRSRSAVGDVRDHGCADDHASRRVEARRRGQQTSLCTRPHHSRAHVGAFVAWRHIVQTAQSSSRPRAGRDVLDCVWLNHEPGAESDAMIAPMRVSRLAVGRIPRLDGNANGAMKRQRHGHDRIPPVHAPTQGMFGWAAAGITASAAVAGPDSALFHAASGVFGGHALA